jgi:ATP-binding cassette subfamily B protein/subfamily B ATP-binding cassette protein MsbA
MEGGEIKEAGTHAELLALNGIYRKLYDIQFG